MIKWKLGNNNKIIFACSSIFSLSPYLAFDYEILLISPLHQQLTKKITFVSLQTFSEDFCNVILSIHPIDMDVCNSTYFATK